jgi:hypothetical protein
MRTRERERRLEEEEVGRGERWRKRMKQTKALLHLRQHCFTAC